METMAEAELDLLSPDLVFMGVDAKDAKDLFTQLEPMLKERGLIKGTWIDAIMAREENYPTGLACPTVGIGIPHTDPENISRPYIAVVKPTHPITFRQMTDKDATVDADIVVNLGIVHAEGQVKILQLLMLVFMDAQAVSEVMAQETPQGLYDTLMSWMRAKEATL
jgi:PTS system galactitol-specific IIA component